MAQANTVLEGTWQEVAARAASLNPQQRVRLELVSSEEISRREEQARIAHVKRIRGKYAHLGVSSDDLHRERQEDEQRSGGLQGHEQ